MMPEPLPDLREAMLHRVANFRLTAIERLLRQWVSLGHADHLADIQKHVGTGIPWSVDRYHCTRDGATLDLRTDTAMGDGMLHITVTPLLLGDVADVK